ncbi:MAG TPA: PadR family transcriptional regulator [Ktedonobacterales bacterium]|jgi:DNA-binding PadR family transcriptional regulator|nr:PadR family transcriptional regulator [Ktedonobacterales bacterium]
MSLTDLGPFADAGLLILASLAAGPKHGYAMLEDIEAMAGVRMGPGTLYTTLARLQQRGWIVALPVDDTRRPYRLTGAGSAVLRVQLGRLERFTASGLKRLGIAGIAEGGVTQ